MPGPATVTPPYGVTRKVTGQLAAPGRAQTRLGLPPARNEGRGPSTDDKVWDSKMRITRPTFEVDDLSFTIPPRGCRQSLD